MLKRGFWFLSILAYIYLGLAGWGYFGTGEWAQKLRGTDLYKVYVKRPVETILGSSGGAGEVSGQILRIKKSGDIRYKPSDSFSFYPADPDQTFYGKNVVSTGPGAEIVLLIGDQKYELTLQENTTVVIDKNLSLGEDDSAPLQVEVLGGKVEAKVSEEARASAPPSQALQIFNVEAGTTQELDPKQDLPLLSDPEPPRSLVPPSIATVPPIQQTQPPQEATPIVTAPPIPPPQASPAPSDSRDSLTLNSSQPSPTNIPFEESQEGFNATVETSMDAIMKSEIKKPSCGEARTYLQEVTRSYSMTERLKLWLQKWNQEILKAKCN